MKKTLLTTATAAALAIGAFVILSSPAVASSPKAKFGAMKKALSAKQDKTMISMTVVGDANGKPKLKVMINGQLVDVPAGTPFEFHDGNKKFIVSPMRGFDDLSPEERAKLEKIIEKTLKEGDGASVTKTVIIDGQTYTGDEADKMIKQHGIKVKTGTGNFQGGGMGGVFIDVRGDADFTFNEADYSKMRFGSDENTLVLTPKKSGSVRYSLKMDPKTNLPSMVTMEKSKDGKWTKVNSSKFQYKPKANSNKIKV